MSSDRPRVCFFVGPSIALTEMRAACAEIDADVLLLPPIQQGDLLRMLGDLPDIIGIVDGYFLQVPAVPHKEILVAIERGARVLGAASMGALRAAELDVFGMEGIGQIYGLYRRGTIDGDDEVAVLHAEAQDGFRPVTEALVNVRYNLRRARTQRIIAADTAAAVLAHAKRLGFSERTLDRILEPTGLGASRRDELAALRDFLRWESLDLKRADALSLARIVAERTQHTQPWPATPRPTLSRTTFLLRYERTYAGRSVGYHHVPDALVLGFQKLLSPGFPRLLRRVTLRCLVVDEALERGLEPDDADTLLARFGARRELPTDEAWQTWLAERCLSREELLAILRERDLEAKLLAQYRARRPWTHSNAVLYQQVVEDVARRRGTRVENLGRPLLMRPGLPWDEPLLRELKLRGAFPAALALAVRVLDCDAEISREIPWFSRSLVPRDTLEAWFANFWGVEVSGLSAALLDRGFAGYAEFSEPARYVYLYKAASEVEASSTA